MGAPPDTSNDAVRTLFESHARDIHRYAARRVGRDLADDVVAETFRRAIESYDTFDPDRGSARGWLFGIATNLLRRHWRTERRRLAALDRRPSTISDSYGDDPLMSVPGRVDAADEAGRVLAAVDGLELEDHDLLVLVAWEQMSSEQVADVLGIPPGTVRSRLHRIRRQLDTVRRSTTIEGDNG